MHLGERDPGARPPDLERIAENGGFVEESSGYLIGHDGREPWKADISASLNYLSA